MHTEQNLTNSITVPNNDWEILRTHFPQCFDNNGTFLLEKFQQNLGEQEINFSTESYGIEWLGKSYSRLLASDAATTLLKADEDHNAKPEHAHSGNLLIKGDNLEVLKHLANAYYEKVKMIYIDPPYNTGSDGFVYNDDRKYTVKELRNLIGVDAEKAKRILDFTQSSSNSHSAWLTFMYPRLYIAKQLLKDDGVIFVSIDDNEVAQLRLLMDEVFGEENFVANIIWEKRYGRSNNAKLITTSTEHILLFRKSEKLENLKEIRNNEIGGYSNPDDDYRGVWTSVSFVNQVSREERPNLSYSITNPNTGEVISHPTNAWKVSRDKYELFLKENRLHWGNDGKAKYPRIKRFLSELDEGMVPVNFWSFKEAGSVDAGTKRVQELLGFDAFTFPKPPMLIQKMLRLFNPDEKITSDDIILDFFAGSGTTGDAVMQLNAEDGGNRKFILVQIPEAIDPKKNKAAFDFVKNELHSAEPTIFDITKERLLRAAKKIQSETIAQKIAEKNKEIEDLESTLDLDGKEDTIKRLSAEIEALQGQDTGFKIVETMPIWDGYDFEAEKFDSSQMLFDTGKLTEADVQALLLTWKTYDGSSLTQELAKVDIAGYTAYYGNKRLYLMHKGFSTENLKALLEKIDADKAFSPVSIIVFGYHFDSKDLRELAENVKSYTNKKSIDIDLITRY
jgi:adenine-specific DNA-methyltransferase